MELRLKVRSSEAAASPTTTSTVTRTTTATTSVTDAAADIDTTTSARTATTTIIGRCERALPLAGASETSRRAVAQRRPLVADLPTFQ